MTILKVTCESVPSGFLTLRVRSISYSRLPTSVLMNSMRSVHSAGVSSAIISSHTMNVPLEGELLPFMPDLAVLPELKVHQFSGSTRAMRIARTDLPLPFSDARIRMKVVLAYISNAVR